MPRRLKIKVPVKNKKPQLSHNVGLRLLEEDYEFAISTCEECKMHLADVLRRAVHFGLPTVKQKYSESDAS